MNDANIGESEIGNRKGNGNVGSGRILRRNIGRDLFGNHDRSDPGFCRTGLTGRTGRTERKGAK